MDQDALRRIFKQQYCDMWALSESERLTEEQRAFVRRAAERSRELLAEMATIDGWGIES